MNNKIKYVAGTLAGVAVLSLTLAATTTDNFRMGRTMEILMNMVREISLFYVDDVDQEKLLADSAAGMVDSLDPYTEYISEEQMATFQTLTTGKYAGIGSLIREDGDYVVFAEPYKDSPADRAGINIGDKILEIDGHPARGLGSSRVSQMLKGDPGTKLNLRIEKLYTGVEEALTITRELITRSGISYYGMVNDSVGYISHSDFTEDCSNDMRNAIMDLKSQGATSLVLDYRNNGGGILQEAVKIVSFFVPKGTEVVSMRGRNTQADSAFLTQNEPIDTEMPLAVIINNGSASSAEIVAGALQDLDRAVILGRRSFGKGLVQTPRPLGYNTYLKITTAKYYLPSGRCVQAIDYASRAEDGSISHIPDSLINEFKTVAGRKVFDGGGVVPDVAVNPEYVSRFAFILYGKGYITDYVDEYMKLRYMEQFDPNVFALADGDYIRFMDFMDDKDVEWESETKRNLRSLRQAAGQERYLEGIEAELDAIEAKLRDDKQANLQLYRDELTQLLENEIMIRTNYSQGMVQHNVRSDEEIKQSAALLADIARYTEILESQDTQRK